MMTLVFTVCLASAPTQCERREMMIFEDMSPIACVMGAPSQLAQWREVNPEWRIARWSCPVPDQRSSRREARAPNRL